MIYVLSGGQTGATLTVTSSGAGTITVSNATLGKSYSKSVTAGGSVVFKGLKTGTWTVRLTNGTQTSTKTITITNDYSTSIAYFSATISITYPAKSTCVVKNSGGTTVASNTNTGTSTKTWTATVNATGTYTVTATATDGSGKSKSQSVSITADGQSKTVTLSYALVLFDGGVGKENWIGKYTQIAGNDASYTIDTELAVSANADGKTAAYITLKDAADLSKYNTLTLEIDSVEYPYSGQYGKLYVYIGTSQYGTDVITKQVTTTGTLSIDISGLTGTGYFITLVATCSGPVSGYPEYSFSCSDVVAA